MTWQLSIIKLRAILGQIDLLLSFNQHVAHPYGLPNTACTGRRGFVAIFRHFLASSFFCSRTLSTPAPPPVTQAVRRPTSSAMHNLLVSPLVERQVAWPMGIRLRQRVSRNNQPQQLCKPSCCHQSLQVRLGALIVASRLQLEASREFVTSPLPRSVL